MFQGLLAEIVVASPPVLFLSTQGKNSARISVCLHIRAVVVIVVAVPERAECFLPKSCQFQPIGCLFCLHWAFDLCYCASQVANSMG